MEFDQLALQKLVQTAPELASLVVAFRDITEESSSEGDVTVGVFILRSGNSFYFVPVIRRDSTIYPIDSVFFADLGVFRPMSKSVVSQILTSQSLDMGKTTKIPRGVTRNPSVHDLVNPPRTGKFVYASDSRLVEFLASTPDHIKQAMFDGITSDSGLATSLSKIFSLRDLLEAVKTVPKESKHVEEAPARATLTYGDALSEAQAREVMEKGYALTELTQAHTRIGIPEEDFHVEGQARTLSASTEGGRCYNIVTSDGEVTAALVLPKRRVGHKMGETLIITETGRYLSGCREFVAIGEELTGEHGPEEIFRKILKGFTNVHSISTVGAEAALGGPENLVILTPEFEFVAMGTTEGVKFSSSEVSFSLYGHGTPKVVAMKGLSNMISDSSNVLCVPYNWPAFRIRSDYHLNACVNINTAQKLAQTRALLSLGDQMDIRHDGVEFSVDGMMAGPAHKAIEIIVARHGFSPQDAEHFVKRASVNKRCRVYMSKEASDFTPGEIPQFGNPPPPQPKSPQDLSNVRQAADTGDKQVAEAMVISELLQSPDLIESITEYVPDVAAAVDRLGRILFLSRVRMDQFIEATGNEAAMSQVASIKAVYRNLGDNLVKLEQLCSNVSKTK